MTQDIFIGVDGGGTQSKVRVEDRHGQLIGQGIGGPANIRLSVEGAWHSIQQALLDALKNTGISLDDPRYRFHAGMGLAGCEVKDVCDTFLRYPHRFSTLALDSDAHTACLGAHPAQAGSIIIMGTGAIGYQIENGKGMRVSGWGFPHDDQGSGAWIGLEAVRLTFHWLDHRNEKSLLAEDIFHFFHDDLDYLVAWANQANSTEFARIAPIVINHSQQEEQAAVRIMKKAAHAIDRISVALCKMQQQKESILPCCLMGGIAPFIEPLLSEELRAKVIPRHGDANRGALIMIRERVKS